MAQCGAVRWSVALRLLQSRANLECCFAAAVSTRGKTAFMAKHKDLGACGSLDCGKAIVSVYKNIYVLDLF